MPITSFSESKEATSANAEAHLSSDALENLFAHCLNQFIARSGELSDDLLLAVVKFYQNFCSGLLNQDFYTVDAYLELIKQSLSEITEDSLKSFFSNISKDLLSKFFADPKFDIRPFSNLERELPPSAQVRREYFHHLVSHAVASCETKREHPSLTIDTIWQDFYDELAKLKGIHSLPPLGEFHLLHFGSRLKRSLIDAFRLYLRRDATQCKYIRNYINDNYQIELVTLSSDAQKVFQALTDKSITSISPLISLDSLGDGNCYLEQTQRINSILTELIDVYNGFSTVENKKDSALREKVSFAIQALIAIKFIMFVHSNDFATFDGDFRTFKHFFDELFEQESSSCQDSDNDCYQIIFKDLPIKQFFTNLRANAFSMENCIPVVMALLTYAAGRFTLTKTGNFRAISYINKHLFDSMRTLNSQLDTLQHVLNFNVVAALFEVSSDPVAQFKANTAAILSRSGIKGVSQDDILKMYGHSRRDARPALYTRAT